MQLVDELLAFWSLEDYETTLEELEEALITADFGPKTALKIVDQVCVGGVTHMDLRWAPGGRLGGGEDVSPLKGGSSE